MINTILIIVSLIAIALILFVMYQKAKMRAVVVDVDDYATIDKILEAVKLEMVEIVKEDYSLGLSDAEFNALYKRKARINDALRNCVYGIDSAKIIVIELIRSFIAENVPKANVTDILGLTEGLEPSNHVKFEIMMYRYKKKYGKEALTEWMKKYDFMRERTTWGAEKKRDVSYRTISRWRTCWMLGIPRLFILRLTSR